MDKSKFKNGRVHFRSSGMKRDLPATPAFVSINNSPAILTSVSIYSHNITLLVLKTRSILNLLLDAATEETLK